MDDASLLSMTWRDVLFAHWAVAPERVRPRLPAGLELDTYDEQAWLGVVAFVMADIRPRFAPLGLSFGELNLRTYVQTDAGPGVYFFNLDADDRLGVTLARRLFKLPYYRASMAVERADGSVRFRSRRTHDGVPSARFDATYGPAGEPARPEPGSLDAFLTERYRFYTASTDVGETGQPRVYRGAIDHEPWPLAPASAALRENSLFEANGFDRPAGEPRLRYCRELDVTAGRIRRVSRAVL
ncbi:hypothetical protein BRC82_08145 [Halobacteriales archaeon QS_1_67_19]|nr:MAG: hypothetical protein BRC82_08145 [Halobacteriales archaeon QS_1_67_19]